MIAILVQQDNISDQKIPSIDKQTCLIGKYYLYMCCISFSFLLEKLLNQNKFIYIIRMSFLDIQKIKVNLAIKKIAMNIKFPCSLTLQIRHDSIIDLKKTYEIRNGQSIINETFQFDTDVPQNTSKNKYEDKKIFINVFMITQSGKVSAGSTSFSLYAREIGTISDQIQFLDKCPDKGAKIYYSYSLQMKKGKFERLDKTLISQLRQNERKVTQLQEMKKKNSYNSMQLPLTTRNTLEQQYFKNGERNTSNNKNFRLTESKVEQIIPLTRRQNKQRVDTSITMPQYLRERNRSRSKTPIKQAISRKTINSQYPLMNQNQLQFKIEEEQDDEITMLKNKLKMYDRVEKSNTLALRELKEQCEKRKNKQVLMEKTKTELEQTLRVKEERLKKAQKTVKQQSQEKEQIFNQIKTIKNQNQVKENALKDQIKKLQDKYKSSQNEREIITTEYNKILKNFQENEKKYQNILKEKDRSIFQDKSKNNKKIDSLISSVSQSQQQIKELNAKIEELAKQNQGWVSKYNLLEQTIHSLKEQSEIQIVKLRAQSQMIQQYSEQIQKDKQQQLERQQLKKKYNELTHQNAQLTQKYNKIEKNCIVQQDKIKELQLDLTKRNNQKNQINNKYLAIKKNYQNLKNTEQQKLRQSQSLTMMHNSANSRIVDLKSKLQIEKKSIEDMQRQYQLRYSSILHQKQSVETEAQELRWQLEKHISIAQQLNTQIRMFNDQNFKLSQQILQKNEKIKKLQQVHKQLMSSNEHLTSNIAQLQKKKKENQLQIKELSLEVSQNKRKMDKYQKQFIDLKEKIKSSQTNTKQKYLDFQKRLKERQQSHQIKQNHITTLQENLKQALDQAGIFKHQLNQANQQINYLKDVLSSNKKDMENQENQLIKGRQLDIENKKIIQIKDEQNIKKSKQIDELSKKISLITEQSKNNLTVLTTNFEHFLQQIIRYEDQYKHIGTNNFSSTLLSYQRISQLQIEYIQKHNSNVSKTKSKQSQLLLEKQNMEYQVNKEKIEFEELRHSLQQELIRQKEKVKVLQNQLTKLMQSEKEYAIKIEEISIAKEREQETFKNQQNKKMEQKSDLQSQITAILSQYQSLKLQNRQLQEKLLQLKSNQIKERTAVESKYQSLVETHEIEIQNIQKHIYELQKRNMMQQKEIAERIESIKKYQNQANLSYYEKDKKDNKIEELQSKYADLQNEAKYNLNLVKEKEKEIKKVNENIQQISRMIVGEKEKYQEILFKNQEQSNIILDLSKDAEKFKEENEFLKEKLKQSEGSNKSKGQAYKNQQEKLIIELKQAKQKIITLHSELQLKKFMSKQFENSIQFEKEQKEELKLELNKKKNIQAAQQESIDLLSIKVKQLQEDNHQITQQKQQLIITIERQKNKISHLNSYTQQETALSDRCNNLQKQLERLKEEKDDAQSYYERQISDLKNSLKQNKKLDHSRIFKQDEMKKKVKALERMLENDDYDVTAQRKKWLQDMQRQKKQYFFKNENLEFKINQLQDQLSSIKSRYRKELQKLTKQIEDLQEENNSKDFIIRNQQVEMDNNLYKLAEVNFQKNKIQSQFEKEKGKYKKAQSQLQNQLKNLKEKHKKIQQEQKKQIVDQIERKMSKLKAKRMDSSFQNELQNLMVTSSYKQFQQILSDVVRQKVY